MRRTVEDVELARHFTLHATSSARRAPLYAALCTGIAGDPSLSRLLLHAPAQQRLPVLLLAASHRLLLDEADHRLAAWYPNLSQPYRDPADPDLLPTYKRFVVERHDALVELLATRRTQTNEVGRCAMFVLAFGLIADEVGTLAHLDVGASGGLNLLLDRYEYRFEPGGTVGGPSTVVVTTGTRGDPPMPTSMPHISTRCGLDVAPVDVTDDDEALWLEACVWPDQADRFHRLAAAIELARLAPPELLAGDAVQSLDPAISRMARSGHPVVTNSWVLNYLTPDARTAYVAELDRIGTDLDISWVYVEAPDLVPELPGPEIVDAPAQQTTMTLVRWRGGSRTVDHLAICHPHGFWIHWHRPSTAV